MQLISRIAPVFCVIWLSYGQGTQVDLKTQSKNVDFSSAGATKPVQTGTTLPSVCSIGQIFFLTTALPGQNVYDCTGTNIWSVEGGGGRSSQISDFQITTNGTVMTIGAACAVATPCNVGFGNTVYSIAAPATATLSAGTGVAYVYISSAGVLTVGHTMTLACSAACVAQSGVTAFPIDSIPLFTWTANAGAWNANGAADKRSFLSTKPVSAGLGLLSTDVGGQTVVQINSAQVGLLTAVPATSASACSTGAWAVNASFYYVCIATNVWRRAAVTTF